MTIFNVPQCGDIGFVGYDNEEASIISRLIKWFTRGWKEDSTKATHQYLVLKNHEILEAGSRSKRKAVIRQHADRMQDSGKYGAHFIVFRPPGINFEQQEKIDKEARELEGVLYGYFEIVLQGLDGLLRKTRLLSEGKPFFTKLGDILPFTRICSGIVNYVLYLSDVVDKAWIYFSPDGAFDAATSQGWEVVIMNENGGDYWFPLQQEEE